MAYYNRTSAAFTLVDVPASYVRIFITLGLVLSAVACGAGKPEVDLTPLQAQKVRLERELDGLRESVALLDAGKSIFPDDDIAIGVDQTLVRRLIAARLPVTTTIAPYTLTVDTVDVGFLGAPTIRLTGRVAREGLLTLEGAATLHGALVDIDVDAATSTLRARMAIDLLDIERAAGIESLVSGSTLEDVAERLRLATAEQLPQLEIPVRVQQEFTIPPLTDGAVRLEGHRLPLGARVSRVFATEGRLWIGIHLTISAESAGS